MKLAKVYHPDMQGSHVEIFQLSVSGTISKTIRGLFKAQGWIGRIWIYRGRFIQNVWVVAKEEEIR